MEITIDGHDGETIDAIVDGITGLEVPVNVAFEFIAGQGNIFDNPTSLYGRLSAMHGQDEHIPPTVNIIKTTVYFGVIDGDEVFGFIKLDAKQKNQVVDGLLTIHEEIGKQGNL